MGGCCSSNAHCGPQQGFVADVLLLGALHTPAATSTFLIAVALIGFIAASTLELPAGPQFLLHIHNGAQRHLQVQQAGLWTEDWECVVPVRAEADLQQSKIQQQTYRHALGSPPRGPPVA